MPWRVFRHLVLVLACVLVISACATDDMAVSLTPHTSVSPLNSAVSEVPSVPDVQPDLTETHIAFMSDRDGELGWYLMQLDGSSVQRLALPTAYDVRELHWISSLRQWAAILGDATEQSDIYMVDLAGQVVSRLTSTPAIESELVYSPVIGKIAFVCGDLNLDICVVNVSGEHSVAELTDSSARDVAPVWSPDGRKLLLVSDRTAIQDIWVMNEDGSDQIDLTNTGYQHGSPSWSPDGTAVLFTSQRDMNWEVYVMGTEGQNPRNLTNDPSRDTTPMWSPDGSYIAFRTDRDGNQEIYVMRADGSDVVNVTQTLEVDESVFVWSPDSEGLLYVSEVTSNPEIYWVNRDGSGRRNLTNHPASDVAPIWVYTP